MKNSISLNLDADRFDHAKNRESLGELLEQAVEITTPASKRDSERRVRDEMRWIARQAVRAVCELIIRQGEINLPLQVQFAEASGIPKSRLDYDGDYSLN